MTILRPLHLTWRRSRDLPRSQVVAISPTGASRPTVPPAARHRHDHRGSDGATAGEKLSNRGYHSCSFPPGYTSPIRRGISRDRSRSGLKTVTALIRDIARSLATHGFTLLAIANAHLDPAHVASVEAALDGNGKDGLPTIVFPDIAKKPWAPRLTEESERRLSCGPVRELGVLACPAGSGPGTPSQALPANPASLSAAIRSG